MSLFGTDLPPDVRVSDISNDVYECDVCHNPCGGDDLAENTEGETICKGCEEKEKAGTTK